MIARRLSILAFVFAAAGCAKTGSEATSTPTAGVTANTVTIPRALTSAPPSLTSAVQVDSRVLACRRLGEASDFFPSGIVMEPGGTLLVAGHCSNTGAAPAIGSAQWGAFGEGGFFAGMDEDGTVRWARQLGGKSEDVAAAAVSPTGDVAVAGAFVQDLDLGDLGGGKITTHDHDGAFALVTDEHGKLRWSSAFDGRRASAKSAHFDPSGRLVVAGEVTGDLKIGPKVIKGSNGDVPSLFVAQFETSGRVRWAHQFGNNQPVHAEAMTVDAEGSTLLAGTFDKDLKLGRVTLHGATHDKGTAFLAKLDVKGDIVWANSFDAAGLCVVHGLATGRRGDIFIGGDFWDDLVLGNRIKSAGGSDAFVAKLDAHGMPIWSVRFGGALDDSGSTLAVDDAGEVTFAGVFGERMVFGAQTLIGAGRNDVFAARLGPDGNPRWASVLTSGDRSGYESKAASVALDRSGNPIVAGWVTTSLPSRLSCGREAIEARSNTTAFVAKLRK